MPPEKPHIASTKSFIQTLVPSGPGFISMKFQAVNSMIKNNSLTCIQGILSRVNVNLGAKPVIAAVSVLLILLIPLHTTGKSGPGGKPDPDWIEKKSNQGISTAYRWITTDNGDRLRQRRVEMVIESSLSAIVDAIKNDGSARRWMNRINQYYSFGNTDEYHWSSYMEFSLPWPMNNQDLVVNNLLKQDPATGEVRIVITGDDHLIPEKDHIDRIPGFSGSWEITPMDDARVKIVYQLFSGKKPWLPLWLIDPIIESGLIDTFDNLQKVISEKNAGHVSLNYIDD